MEQFLSRFTFGLLMAQVFPGGVFLLSLTCPIVASQQAPPTMSKLFLSIGSLWFSSTKRTAVFLFLAIELGMFIHGLSWLVMAWLENHNKTQDTDDTTPVRLSFWHNWPFGFQVLVAPGIFKPKIHEACESRLFVIRIRMGHPVYSQYKVIIEYLISRFSDCFCLYETWGTYDVNIFLWGKHDVAGAISLKRRLEERLAGSKVEIRTAARIHDFHCSNPGVPDNVDPVHALAVQDGIRLPDLNPDEYLCQEFPEDVPEHSVRAFTYVALVEPSIDRFIRNAIIRNVHDKLGDLMQKEKSPGEVSRFHRLSLVELSPPEPELAADDAAVLVVSFVASEYRYLAELPTAIIGAIGDNAVKTSSFLETRRVVVQSDKILF